MKSFKATHLINAFGRRIRVMLVGPSDGKDGVAFQRSEWKSGTLADFEVDHGTWLFKGQPFSGMIRKFKSTPDNPTGERP